MTDVSSQGGETRRSVGQTASPAAAPAPAAPSFADLVACAELFYFAYRDFTGDPDAILDQYGFGRAHHRVLHFVYRSPGLKVAQLLDILKITKQSLARVLKQLIDEGFIVQRHGDEDRRERRLYVSPKGARLTEKLTQIQVKRLAAALEKIGPGAEPLARQFLFEMIAEKDRSQVESLIKSARGSGTSTSAAPVSSEP